ncbi:hypothetical protein NI17_001950 [Thermobifida halotolerans]|uniref:DUF5753 domain-containing protein n=1 Tax=Thermobifida halotolerans TaxID=483545 RepID=A0AA97LY39_9ACTN|nr:Scr1 family TA system antitoxin-like transcriptional regulator [Thermobifida halotolerans]UOE20041.1 hypothetical protein NI17_001950 [Thermobifida halotolerans]
MTEEEPNGLATTRIDRQAVFTSDLPPRYVAVIDEGVFHRPTGGRQVMAAQIDHLLAIGWRPV